MTYRDALQEFLGDYEPEGRGAPLTTGEQTLVEEALSDFLLTEDWSTEYVDGSSASQSIAELRHLCPSKAAWSKITDVEGFLLALVGRLTRREEANLIMREHLTMLSEQLKMLRSSTH